MSTEPDRDPVTDALLRKALQPTPQVGTDGCVDAETLAAWADGKLPADQAADVEAHLAGCSRCQAVLGAFAMTDESAAPAASPAAVIPFRPKSPVRWLLPLAASIAATLVLWTAVRNRPATSAPELQQTFAKAEAPPPAPVMPPALADAPANRSDAAPRTTPVPPAALAKRQAGTASKDKTVAANESKASAAPRPAAAPVPAPVARPTGSTSADRALAVPPQPVVAPPPPPASAAPPVQVVAGSALGQSRSMAETVRTEPRTETTVAEFTARVSITLDGVAGAGGGGGGRGAAGGRGGGAGAAARLAVPPAQPTMPVRWRVLGSGQVVKSTNGGETWVPVPLSPPVFIVSGDAPSPSVCWLAGRSGVVMRSIDATTFTRIVFPDTADLRSITAIDARQATVTTASGQVFATTDGGQTWQLK